MRPKHDDEVMREKEWLVRQFGALIALPDAARLLGFRTPGALRAAAQRGTAPVRLVRAQPRRRLVVLAEDLARYLVQLRGAAARSAGAEAEREMVTVRRGSRRVEVRV